MIPEADENDQNDLISRITAFRSTHDQKEETATPRRSETQIIVLTAGAQRPDKLAMPPPKGLSGAAAKMSVIKMIEHGWLQVIDANP